MQQNLLKIEICCAAIQARMPEFIFYNKYKICPKVSDDVH